MMKIRIGSERSPKEKIFDRRTPTCYWWFVEIFQLMATVLELIALFTQLSLCEVIKLLDDVTDCEINIVTIHFPGYGERGS
jgi:hypothetical protein